MNHAQREELALDVVREHLDIGIDYPWVVETLDEYDVDYLTTDSEAIHSRALDILQELAEGLL